MVKGAVKTATGIATGNFVSAVQGAAEALSPKVIAAIAGILVFLILLPIMIISAIPQMLFSWGTVDDEELIARNRHGTELAACYEETIAELDEGVNPDIYWLISIESVLHKQKIEVVYYNQLDSRWANLMYGKSSTIGAAMRRSWQSICPAEN